MKNRYRLVRRNDRGGTFYLVDNLTNLRESLNTTESDAAEQILHARLQAQKQPAINLQIARAYLAATDEKITKRAWRDVMEEMSKLKKGSTLERWQRAVQDIAFDDIRNVPLLETKAEHFLRVLEKGTVATNVFLRRLHNFALDMSWVPWPILPKKQWPPARFGEKRAITKDEHERIVKIEWQPERRAFYELLWHLGGSQTDIATLKADSINWEDDCIVYARGKTNTISFFHFGPDLREILKRLPSEGPLFPKISFMHEKHRAAEFKRRVRRLKIQGITLHSYRYAWAERAKRAGYPERFAQEALGHNSTAVHRAYARKAQVKIPSLEEFERERSDSARVSTSR